MEPQRISGWNCSFPVVSGLDKHVTDPTEVNNSQKISFNILIVELKEHVFHLFSTIWKVGNHCRALKAEGLQCVCLGLLDARIKVTELQKKEV